MSDRAILREIQEDLQDAAAGRSRALYLEGKAMFSAELLAFQAILATGLDAAHALVNGKWLVDDAARRTRRPTPQCRDEWTRHLRSAGGDPEILAWWRRTVAA